MLSDHDFALELIKVQRFDFVDQVTAAANTGQVFIELSPRLVELLPHNRRVLGIERADFSVAFVIEQYETLVVEHLILATDIATEMLRSAKRQAQ